MDTEDGFNKLMSELLSRKLQGALPTLCRRGWMTVTGTRAENWNVIHHALVEDDVPVPVQASMFLWHSGRPAEISTSTSAGSCMSGPNKRPDFPVVRHCLPPKRSKLQFASTMARSADRDSRLSDLERDKFSNSSRAPQEARWDTWCKIARSWDSEPLPVTTTLVNQIGASMKSAGYRSAKMYFDTAKTQHLKQIGTPVSDLVARTIKDVVRSIARGLGGSTSKPPSS
jgi:hypothetical protein